MAEEEQEEVNQDSLYAILNLPKDASDDEIKKSYRQLAQVCHPDKTPETVAASGANANFMRIQEAYEILSNEEKRNIYDIYGKEGLEAGFELGEPLRSSRDLKDEYEKFKSQRKAQQEEQSVAHRGVYSFKVDACDALDPYDRSVTHIPELINVATTNSVQLPLSDKTVASIGCQVGVRRSVGGGRFMCGIKRILTPQDSLDINASLGLKSFVSATATRQLGEYTSADVTTSWHPQAGLGLSLTTSRRLSLQTEADFTCQVGPESCVMLGISRHGQRYLVSGRLEAGASTGFVGKVVCQITASISLRASAKLGTMGIELEVGGSHRVSDFSTAGCSVVAGLQGIILRPKFSRGGHVFEMPILLSTNVRDYNLLVAAYILPPALAYVTKSWIIQPLRKRAKLKKIMEGRVQQIQEIQVALEEARAASLVLESVANRKLRKEIEKGGLVIVSARYGLLSAIRSAEHRDISETADGNGKDTAEMAGPSSSEQFAPRDSETHLDSDGETLLDAEIDAAVQARVQTLPEAYLDVTVPLRFQVKDSSLVFHKGISKSQMMGFCDIAIGEDKTLLIYFIWHGKAHSVAFADRAGGSLPQDGSVISAQEQKDLVDRLMSRQGLPRSVLQ